jgi:hypothetical protein
MIPYYRGPDGRGRRRCDRRSGCTFVVAVRQALRARGVFSPFSRIFLISFNTKLTKRKYTFDEGEVFELSLSAAFRFLFDCCSCCSWPALARLLPSPAFASPINPPSFVSGRKWLNSSSKSGARRLNSSVTSLCTYACVKCQVSFEINEK